MRHYPDPAIWIPSAIRGIAANLYRRGVKAICRPDHTPSLPKIRIIRARWSAAPG